MCPPVFSKLGGSQELLSRLACGALIPGRLSTRTFILPLFITRCRVNRTVTIRQAQPTEHATQRQQFKEFSLQDQARVTGLPVAEIQQLPTDLLVTTPPGGDDGLSAKEIYIICGSVAGVALLAALLGLAFYSWRMRSWRSAHDFEMYGDYQVSAVRSWLVWLDVNACVIGMYGIFVRASGTVWHVHQHAD